MKPITAAVIDVGTNSVKLLVAEVHGGLIHPLLEESEQTRLGSGFYETRQLQPQAIEQTAGVVADYAEQARLWAGVTPVVIATSAARDAMNQDQLLSAIRKAAGLEVQVISGDQEAEWALKGVASDPALAEKRLLILDVGGGSTEFIVGEGAHHAFRQSFPLGSVRLLERLRPADPPTIQDLTGCREWLQEFFNAQVTPALERFLGRAGEERPTLVGTGGTATILARMEGRMDRFDRTAIEATRLTRTKVLEWMVALWSKALEERRQIVGLPRKRADIILTGVAIYEAVMEHFHLEELRVSTRGLRFGAILEACSR